MLIEFCRLFSVRSTCTRTSSSCPQWAPVSSCHRWGCQSPGCWWRYWPGWCHLSQGIQTCCSRWVEGIWISTETGTISCIELAGVYEFILNYRVCWVWHEWAGSTFHQGDRGITFFLAKHISNNANAGQKCLHCHSRHVATDWRSFPSVR